MLIYLININIILTVLLLFYFFIYLQLSIYFKFYVLSTRYSFPSVIVIKKLTSLSISLSPLRVATVNCPYILLN